MRIAKGLLGAFISITLVVGLMYFLVAWTGPFLVVCGIGLVVFVFGGIGWQIATVDHQAK